MARGERNYIGERDRELLRLDFGERGKGDKWTGRPIGHIRPGKCQARARHGSSKLCRAVPCQSRVVPGAAWVSDLGRA